MMVDLNSIVDEIKTFSSAQRAAVEAKVKRINADRIARNGEPAYDPKEVIRDVVASNRLSGIDSTEWAKRQEKE